MTENKRYNLRAGYYHNYAGIGRNKEENLTTNQVCDKLNSLIDENEQLKQQIRKLNRINNICEEQIKELRRLVNIATQNDFIKDSKKEEWEKELMRE